MNSVLNTRGTFIGKESMCGWKRRRSGCTIQKERVKVFTEVVFVQYVINIRNIFLHMFVFEGIKGNKRFRSNEQ
eukprot:m.28911 g.28911  ORF g.28911 m.28911 type:complete len:74 (+) comp9518_c0_seq2:207-428(+)